MASKIILKKSSVAAKAPVAADLEFGELALNYTDSKLYFKKADGTTIDAFTGSAASGTVTSVGLTPGTGISVSGSPITTSGNITVTNTAPNVTTDISTTHNATTVVVNSSDGTDGTINAATTSLAGVMTGADKTKLDGIAAGATNVTNNNQLTNGAGYITSSGSITGSSRRIEFIDGPRNLTDRLPNTLARSVNWDFVGAGIGNGVGNYAGVMSFTPWDGTSASTGDSSYQLAFANQSGVNASGPARLSIRNGIDTTWNAWQEILTSSNYNSYSPTLTGTGASGTWGINITGNAATATNISNTGTVTLATATESNSINITAPSYSTDTPVKLLNFDWYGNVFSMGNIRSGGTPTNGFGIYHTPSGGSRSEIARFNTAGNLRLASGLQQGADMARPLAQWAASGAATGMVFFELPGTTSNYGMVHAVVDIYEYNSNSVCTVIVGGHNWNGAWYNVGANVIGQTDKQVRLGVRSGKYVICIGSAGSSWSYGTVVLRKIHNGSFYTGIMDMSGPFVANITTTESLTSDSGDLRALRTPSSFNAGGTITSTSDVRAPIFYDSNDTAYYVDPAGNSELKYTRFSVSGYPIVAFNNTNSSDYGLIEWTDSGVHKMWMGMGGSAQSLGENAAYAQDGFSINHDGGGALTISNRGTSRWIRFSTGDENTGNFHTLNVRNGDVIVNQNAITYSIMDNTPVVGVATTNRLHVNGSIQLTGNNDAIVFGRGTSTFLKDEELGFGWGGGWYMTDDTYLRVRGSKILYNDYIIRSDTDMRAPIFYDQNDTGYYLDPNTTGTSIRVAGYAYFGLGIDGDGVVINHDQIWTPAGNFHIQYSGSGDVDMNYGGGHTFSRTSLRAPIFYDWNDTAYYIDPNSTSNSALRMRGGALFGPNTTWGASLYVGTDGRVGSSATVAVTNGNLHIDAQDGYSLYLNWYNTANIYTQSNLGVGSSSADYRLHVHGTGYATSDFRAPIFYDSNNTGYYVDPASTSVLNALTVNSINASSHIHDSISHLGRISAETGRDAYRSGVYTFSTFTAANPGGNPPLSYPEIIAWGAGGGGSIQLAGDWISTTSTPLRVRSLRDCCQDWSSWSVVATSNESFTNNVDLRAPIFYDSNDTSYYVNPNSGSRIYDLNIEGASNKYLYLNPGNGYEAMVRYNGGSGSGWYVGKRTASVLVGTESFHFYSEAAGATVGGVDTAGNMFASGSHRAPIFYDSNNTAYYVDPNTYTYLYGGIANNGAHGNSTIMNRLLPEHNGASTGEVRLQMWCSEPGITWDWAGFGYNVTNDGGTPSGFSRPNTGFGQAYMRMGTGGQWYFYTTNTSGTRYTNMYLAPDNGVETYGILRNDTDVRAPIYYDSNNTAFYLDPNTTGTSLNVAGAIVAAGNITANSDESLKTDWSQLPADYVEKLSKLLSGTFTRKDTGQRQTGIGAQSLQKFLPEAVVGETILSVAYGNAAMVSAVELAKRVVEQDARIAKLEERLSKLLGD